MGSQPGSRSWPGSSCRGRQLHISEATVKTHLIHIFEKLDASDRTQAVTVAIPRGIVQVHG
jgi:DNA-binding CsgD family transcriptional regulator